MSRESSWEPDMQGPVANGRSPHGRVLSREVTRSGAFWNFGKMAGCVWSMGGGEAGGREEVTAVSR